MKSPDFMLNTPRRAHSASPDTVRRQPGMISILSECWCPSVVAPEPPTSVVPSVDPQDRDTQRTDSVGETATQPPEAIASR